MRIPPILAIIPALLSLTLAGCGTHKDEHHHHARGKVVVTSPQVKDVVTTQQYVCQIHSRRHIEVCALESGYLQQILVKEGQGVKQGGSLFKILPTLYQAKLDTESAEAQLVQIEYNNTKRLFEQNVVSNQEVALAQAKLAKAQAQVSLARAELNFTDVKAPFDGIVDRLHEQLGSLVEEGDVLTTLSDNSVMWVYFNVPEARYLEYMSELERPREKTTAAQDIDDEDDDQDGDDLDDDDDEPDDVDDDDDGGPSHGNVKNHGLADAFDDQAVAFIAGPSEESRKIELVLADGAKFPHDGEIGAIEALFNNETGNIPFRADFPNPDGLLRHGQTGNVLIQRTLKDALVIPQRAVFEILDKQYVYVLDKQGVIHQREIVVRNEMDDIFVIASGLSAHDRFVIEGVRQVSDGDKVEAEYRAPEKILANQKYHAE